MKWIIRKIVAVFQFCKMFLWAEQGMEEKKHERKKMERSNQANKQLLLQSACSRMVTIKTQRVYLK